MTHSFICIFICSVDVLYLLDFYQCIYILVYLRDVSRVWLLLISSNRVVYAPLVVSTSLVPFSFMIYYRLFDWSSRNWIPNRNICVHPQFLVGFVLFNLCSALFVLLSFCFGHCVVFPSLIYPLWLPILYLLTLVMKFLISSTNNNSVNNCHNVFFQLL